MGNDYSKELPSSWDNDKVQKWKKTAAEAQKAFYLGLGGTQWDEYGPDDHDLLTVKICFIMFGQPKDVDNNEVDIISSKCYKEEQREVATKIKDTILKVHRNCPDLPLRVFILIIACKKDDAEFFLPLFRVFVGLTSDGKERSNYIDTDCRVYKSWRDWLDNNKIPMLKYCYPLQGYYTCADYKYEFDSNEPPVLGYGTSPSCNLSSRALRQGDTATGITGLVSGGVFIVGMFTPLAPALAVTAAIAGTTSAVYGASRSGYRLYDKGSHGESLTDLESFTCWLTIAATPLHFASSATNGVLARGAQTSGRIFSNTTRTLATVLNVTTFGVDCTMFVVGIANLIDKAEKKQLTSLDVLQFSMSIFFFTHTLVQPKTASGIIKQAQNEYIKSYQKQMTDTEAQQAFKNFVEQNRGEHEMRGNSRIIRTINRIDDPNKFFKGTSGSDLKIGGRKGKTVLVTDAAGRTTRVNPNRVFFDSRTGTPLNAGQVRNALTTAFGQDIETVTINGENIFGNRRFGNRELRNIRRTLGEVNYDRDIIQTARNLADHPGLNCQNVNEFLSVCELVKSEVAGLEGAQLQSRLSSLNGAGRQAFVDGIQSDMQCATSIAGKAGLRFADPLKAVYHYRKHGCDFPTNLSNKIKFYLDTTPKKLFRDANLTNIKRLANGTTMKSFMKPDGKFGVLLETPKNRTIVTMYQNPQALATFISKMEHAAANKQLPPADFHSLLQSLADGMGLMEVICLVDVNGKSMKFEDFTKTDDTDVIEHMARMLCSMHI